MNEWEWQLLEEKQPLDQILVNGVSVKCGDRVILRPKGRSDILDLVLVGKIAVIEAIEQDYEGQAHVAVVIEDDPGRDFGIMRQPGHRFFFSTAEVEPLVKSRSTENL